MSFEEWYDLHKDDISEKVELRLSLKDLFASAHLAGAEPREKRIAELEAQIEKMKCCGNCKYRDDMTSYCKKHKKEIYIFMVDSKCNDWKLFD